MTSTIQRLEELNPNGLSANSNQDPYFPVTAPAANPVFYRTYSRKTPFGRESWQQVAERNLEGLRQLGQLDGQEVDLIRRMQQNQTIFARPVSSMPEAAPRHSTRDDFGVLVDLSA